MSLPVFLWTLRANRSSKWETGIAKLTAQIVGLAIDSQTDFLTDQEPVFFGDLLSASETKIEFSVTSSVTGRNFILEVRFTLLDPSTVRIDSVFFRDPGGGNDTLLSGAGNDLLDGGSGAGSDDYGVDDTGDTAIENKGAGSDRVTASVSFGLGANVEDLTLTGEGGRSGSGGKGNDELDGGLGNGSITLDGVLTANHNEADFVV